MMRKKNFISKYFTLLLNAFSTASHVELMEILFRGHFLSHIQSS